MSKITKPDAKDWINDTEYYVNYTETAVKHLPRTPGRDTVEEGVALVRRGLATIKKEAELP
jgi:hypothetical protein